MARCAKINVEHAVGGLRKLALDKIHQQEGEVVEHIAGGHERIELERVERDRAALDQRDVAEVQITVAAANETLGPAREQQGAHARKCGAACGGERRDSVWLK